MSFCIATLWVQPCDFVYYEGSKAVGRDAFMDFDFVGDASRTANYDYKCYAYVRVPCSKLTPEFLAAYPDKCSTVPGYSDHGFFVQ